MGSRGFYLTGGTALSEFYLQHRYSDDLDFFTRKDEPLQDDFQAFTEQIKSLGFVLLDQTVATDYAKLVVSEENGKDQKLKIE